MLKARLTQSIRQMTGLHWLMLFGGILLAWAALFAMSVPSDLRAAGAIYGAEFWLQLCTMTPDAAGAAKMVLMWVLMSAAMMAPTALPAFATYDDLGQTAEGTRFGDLVFGYLAVWVGFSLLAAGMQMLLLRADLVSVFGDSRHFASGFLRHVPVPVQGASMRTRSIVPRSFFKLPMGGCTISTLSAPARMARA